MAISKITITDAMAGAVISPFPDGHIARLELVRTQWPVQQPEAYLPYPFCRWVSGRFHLKDDRGTLFNFATESALFASRVVINGTSYAYRGDLFLECALRGQEWLMEISGVPVIRSQAA